MTKISLYVGDCLKKLNKLEENSIDVVVTSPPYNLGIKYDVYDDSIDRQQYINFILKVFTQLHAKLKPNGSMFVNLAGSSKNPMLTFQLPMLIGNLGFVLQNHIVWAKSITIDDITKGHYKPINSDRYLNNTHETVLHFTKNGKVKLDRLSLGVPYADKSNIKRRGHKQDLKCAGNIWFIPTPTKNSKTQTFNHPATFPLELPTRCIKLHGKVNKLTVLDPFCGVGTSLVAAKQLGCKKAIGIDLSKNYIKISRERLKHD